MKLRHLHPQVLRAAWWADRELRRVRAQVEAGGLDALQVSPPRDVSERARAGVVGVLHRRGATCLPRAAIWQSWEAARGRPCDLVIGVTAPSAGFRAHAWLDGDARCHELGFTELTRRPPPSRPVS